MLHCRLLMYLNSLGQGQKKRKKHNEDCDGDIKILRKNRAMLLTSWMAALFCSLPQVESKFNATSSKFENLEGKNQNFDISNFKNKFIIQNFILAPGREQI